MEEGLEELLEEFTRFKKDGDFITFSAISTPSKKDVLNFFSAIGGNNEAPNQTTLSELAPIMQEPEAQDKVVEEKIEEIEKPKKEEPKEAKARKEPAYLKGYSAVQKHHYKFLVQNNPVGVRLTFEEIKFPDELPEGKKGRFLGLLVAAGLVEEDFDNGIYKILKK